jgi:hypothetical protein
VLRQDQRGRQRGVRARHTLCPDHPENQEQEEVPNPVNYPNRPNHVPFQRHRLLRRRFLLSPSTRSSRHAHSRSCSLFQPQTPLSVMDGVEDPTKRFHTRKARSSNPPKKKQKRKAIMKHGEDGKIAGSHTQCDNTRTDRRETRQTSGSMQIVFFMSLPGACFYPFVCICHSESPFSFPSLLLSSVLAFLCSVVD